MRWVAGACYGTPDCFRLNLQQPLSAFQPLLLLLLLLRRSEGPRGGGTSCRRSLDKHAMALRNKVALRLLLWQMSAKPMAAATCFYSI